MKRILILALVLLFSLTSIVRSRYYYRPVRYRTRYSPYALDHNKSGLVSGNVRYSPYALGHNKSGLVPDNVRYSPYALGHNRSGLVADFYYSNYYTYYPPCKIVIPDNDSYNRNIDDDDINGLDYNAGPKTSRKITLRLKDSKTQITVPKKADGKEIIYRYLKSKKIDFKVDRIFRVGNKTISADFLLKDKNVIIKYWNLEDIEEITSRSQFNNNIYNKYLSTWSGLLDEYRQAGVNVYPITSAGEKEILNRLGLLSELNG